MAQPFAVTLPLPPREVGKNGSHKSAIAWQTMFNTARAAAQLAIVSEINGRQSNVVWQPHRGPIILFYRWFAQTGSLPDPDNIVGRLAPYQDGAQTAGLFVNDAQVMAALPLHIGYRGKSQARVELVFSLLQPPEWMAILGFAAERSGCFLPANRINGHTTREY